MTMMKTNAERERECRILSKCLGEIPRHRIQDGTLTHSEGKQSTCRGHLIYADTTGSLCARDYKGIGSQYVEENKLVIDIWN
jgi:hypothetical protein